MIPAAFDYTRVNDVDEAVKLLVENGGARVLAGGHSLLPELKLRRTSARLLVDLWPLRSDLASIGQDNGTITVGGLARYVDIERSPLIREHLPLLAHAAGQVGDSQVRRRGTIGGSLANAAAAADLPGVTLALDAEVVVYGPNGERTMPVDALLVGDHQTSLAPNEIITQIRFPVRATTGWSYQRFVRRTQDWPTVAVSVNRTDAGTAVTLTNVGDRPVRATDVEAAMSAGSAPDEAAAQLNGTLDPKGDVKASAVYRRHLARVLTERALRAAA